jgi:hypothetical protein
LGHDALNAQTLRASPVLPGGIDFLQKNTVGLRRPMHCTQCAGRFSFQEALWSSP